MNGCSHGKIVEARARRTVRFVRKIFMLNIGGFIYELYLNFIHGYFLVINVCGLYEVLVEYLDGF